MTDHTIRPDWNAATADSSAAGSSYLRMSENDPVVSLSSGGTSNDYDSASYGHLHFSVASSGTHTITGFSGGVSGRVLVVTCEGGTVNLAHANGGSVAANRLSNLTGATVALTPYQRAMYIYSGTVNVWYELPLLTRSPTLTGLTLSGVMTLTSTTTPQAYVRYDASNHLGISVSDAGAITFTATGSGGAFALNKTLTINSKTSISSTTGFITFPESTSANPQVADADGNGIYTITTDVDEVGLALAGYGVVYGRNDGAVKLGFFQGGPGTQATVSGSTGGNAALQSLLNALASYGLIVDSTT